MSADALRARIQQWAARLRVVPTQIRIQSMTGKWASCSPAGRVTFSQDLVRERRDFQDYVIVHELLHLRWRNHGKLFKSTLRAYLKGNRHLSGEI
jgi:predicted metal-dependent hydrolase